MRSKEERIFNKLMESSRNGVRASTGGTGKPTGQRKGGEYGGTTEIERSVDRMLSV